MNLQETKEHIINTCNGYPEVMQQAAINVIEKKQQDELIKTWAVNNKDELVRTLEFLTIRKGISKLESDIDLIKKTAIQLKNKKIKGKSFEKELLTLIVKIDLL